MGGLYPNDASILDTIGRLLIVALFAILAARNLTTFHTEDHVTRMGLARCPMPRQVFWAGTILEIIGVVLVVSNWHPAVGVMCLIVFTISASLLLHRFWEMSDPVKRTGTQNGLCANLAVVGGLLLLLQNVR